MNYKIVIDPGHGGEDSGATGNNIIEKDYTIKISQYIKDRLDKLGIPNQIVRETDETISPSERINRIKSYYGTGNNVIVLSNHINAGGGDGAEVIYALRNNDILAKSITEELSKEGQNIRKYYQRRLPSDSSKDYYFILRDTENNQSVLIEYGFLDSTLDDVQQLKENWKNLAEAVVKAVSNYIGVDYIPENLENTYIVQKGDSLWSIAKKYNLTVNELKELNNLSSNLLSIGQILKIKNTTESPNIESPAGSKIYIVQKGDTLYTIAKKFNTSVEKLKKYNNLSSNTLSIGQKLLIPKEESKSTESEIIYIVQKGDSLYSIADKYSTTVETLKNINNLKSNLLSIGQKLVIPSTENYITYEVQKGDTLYAISQKYNVDIETIKNINNLANINLSINQKLIIPN